jgi:hypothetical protein
MFFKICVLIISYFPEFSGAVFSLVMFRRRAWPIIFGLGSGFGMGYANCENAFNKPLLQKCKKS